MVGEEQGRWVRVLCFGNITLAVVEWMIVFREEKKLFSGLLVV